VLLTSVALATALVATTGAATIPTDPGGGAPTAFARSLDRVPAAALDADGAMVTYVDMDLAWDRAGIGSDPDERLDRISALFDPATWTQTPQLFGPSAMRVDEARAEVGFTTFDIAREIAVLAPPRSITIAETPVPPEDIAAAVESDPVWSADATTVETPDGDYYQWGDDPIAPNADRITPMRPLGQGGQLAVVADGAGSVVARTLEGADTVLATMAGGQDSLLDTDLFATAVAALGKGAVLQAVGLPGAQPFDPAVIVLSTESIDQLLDDVVLVPRYDGLLLAEVYDGERSQTELVFAYGDAADADESVRVFERALAESVNTTTMEPLADVFPDATVRADGSVVVVTLPSEGAYRIAQRMLFERSLFPAG
jgi:hypothetical protein